MLVLRLGPAVGSSGVLIMLTHGGWTPLLITGVQSDRSLLFGKNQVIFVRTSQCESSPTPTHWCYLTKFDCSSVSAPSYLQWKTSAVFDVDPDIVFWFFFLKQTVHTVICSSDSFAACRHWSGLVTIIPSASHLCAGPLCIYVPMITKWDLEQIMRLIYKERAQLWSGSKKLTRDSD